MMTYAIAVLPLIQALADQDKWIRIGMQMTRHAVSSCHDYGSGLITSSKRVQTTAIIRNHRRPSYWLKDEVEANRPFGELGVRVVTGQHFLGGFIGDQESTEEFVRQKVQMWMRRMDKLTKAAESQPQAAHAALTKPLQFEWAYLQSVVPNCTDAFVPLRDAINEKYLPAVVGGVSHQRRKPCFRYQPARGNGYLRPG